MDELIAFMDSKDDGSPQVLMGSTSNGPGAVAIDGSVLSERYLENYEKAIQAGFSNAYDDQEFASAATSCTVCFGGSNLAYESVRDFGETRDGLSDHVLARNAEISMAERILDETLTF